MNLREWKSMTPGEWACNLALYAIGVGIMPMGVVLTINAHLGAGGYDALNFALAERLHINTSLAIYATAFQKKSIDISALIGYTVISYME